MIVKDVSKSKGHKLAFSLLIYWFILIVWQNIGNYTAYSSVAMIIKLFLIAYLAIQFISVRIVMQQGKVLVWLCFSIFTLMVFFFIDNVFSSTTLVYYLFPILFSFMTLVCQHDTVIEIDDFFKFLKTITVVVAYMAFYSVFFKTQYFSNLLYLSSAYGNELTSFLISSHEYGMYLVFGIISSLFCFWNSNNRLKKIIYIFAIVLFSFNLLATLSRTSIASFTIFLVLFIIVSEKKKVKGILVGIAITILALILIVPEAREFVFKIVFKEQNDSGRFFMWKMSLDEFRSSSILTKLFGNGYSKTIAFVTSTFSHGSTHNAFVQVLMTFGIVGELFLFGLVGSAIANGIKVIRIDRNYGSLFIALAISSVVFMFTNTACLMQSPIDSYLLTVFTLIVPKYVSNGLIAKQNKNEN